MTTLMELLDTNLKISQSHSYSRWADQDITIGARWAESIGQAILTADFGLLLISPAFLASDYVINNELPYFLDTNGQLVTGKRIIPVALKPIAKRTMAMKGLEHRQIFFNNDKTFLDCSRPIDKHNFALELFKKIELAISNTGN